MSPDGAQKLVMMANQIATAFADQDEDPAARTAAHMQTFWAPRMRAQIIAHLDAGVDGLSPIAAAAVRRLQAESAARRSAG